MRKLSIALSLSISLIATIIVLRPQAMEQNDFPIPHERAEYAAFMNEYMAAMPKRAEANNPDKFSRPDMFAVFDKMKRLDPVTGEVPADGYRKAYRYIKKEWGDASMQRSGYALQWDERGPTNVGGRTRAILWDLNDSNGKAFFAGGVGGGLWWTGDVTVANPNWVNVNPTFSNVAVTCITADPSNPQTMYYGTGETWNNIDAIRGAGIWKSTDGGMNWELMASTDTSSFYYVQKLAVTSAGDLYCATSSGLWRSKDGGMTMEKVIGLGTGLNLEFMTDLEIGGDGDIYVGINGAGIYESVASLGASQGDMGTWTRLSTGLSGSYDRVEVAVGQSNANYIYTVAEINDGTTNIYRSTNGGANWSATGAQPAGGADYSNGQAWYDLCLEVDPSDHLAVYTGAIDQYRTLNGGSSWSKMTSAYSGGAPYMHPDQHNIAISPLNSNDVVYGNDGGVWYSSSRGSSPQDQNSGYNVTQFYSLAINPKAGSPIIIGGTQDNGSIMVNQLGIGPGTDLTGGDGGYCAINPLFPDTMFTTSQWQSTRRSKNGGATFNSISNPSLDDDNTLFINPMEIDPANPNILYQASTSLWRHSNASSGGSGGWRRVTTNLGGLITAIGASKTPGDLAYMASNGSVYRLANMVFANQNTVPVAVNPAGAGNGYINCILVDPDDGNHIVVTYSSFGLVTHVIECYDADLGATATWRNISGNLPDLPCNWAAFEPNNPNGLLVGTDMGIFRCADRTVATSDIYWSPESRGMGFPRVDMIKTRYSDNSVHLATHGRGFFSTYTYSAMPSANFGIVKDSVCGGIVEFVDSTANVPTGWQWDFGDGNSSTLQSPFHQYASSGTYMVTLVVDNPNGSDSLSQSVTITVLPAPTALAGLDISGCLGDTVYFSGSGGLSYSWAPDFALSDANSSSPYHVINGSRTYILTVWNAEGCADSDTMEVMQNAVPSVWAGSDVSITAVNDSAQMGAAGADFYSWDPSTGLSCSNCADPKAYPAVTTTYTVTGTNTGGCSRTDQVTVTVGIVGVEDAVEAQAGALFPLVPNPVSGSAVIHYKLKKAADVRIEVVNIQGQVLETLKDGRLGPGEHQLNWNVDAKFAAGIYFIRMNAGGQFSIQKALVK